LSSRHGHVHAEEDHEEMEIGGSQGFEFDVTLSADAWPEIMTMQQSLALEEGKENSIAIKWRHYLQGERQGTGERSGRDGDAEPTDRRPGIKAAGLAVTSRTKLAPETMGDSKACAPIAEHCSQWRSCAICS
jgi:hypothetical protein